MCVLIFMFLGGNGRYLLCSEDMVHSCSGLTPTLHEAQIDHYHHIIIVVVVVVVVVVSSTTAHSQPRLPIEPCSRLSIPGDSPPYFDPQLPQIFHYTSIHRSLGLPTFLLPSSLESMVLRLFHYCSSFVGAVSIAALLL
jgi:hypothetical protein